MFHGHVSALIENGIRRHGTAESYADQTDKSWHRVDWPSLTRRVTIDGCEVNLVDTGGDKPPLLFLHGLGGSWQSWMLNIKHFSADHRVIALDLPGFGLSQLPRQAISIPVYAEFIKSLCHSLNLPKVTVVGNSMGGQIASAFALEHPHLVNRLVLISSAGLPGSQENYKLLHTVGRLWAEHGSWLWERREKTLRRPLLRRAVMQVVLRYPEKISGSLALEIVQGTGKPGFLPGLDAVYSHSLEDRLHRLDCPVLIVWGQNDMQIPVSDAHLFTDLIGENSRAVVFEDTGHCAMLERPERFNRLLTEFLNAS